MKYILALIVSLLVGCAAIEPDRYDSTQAAAITNIWQAAQMLEEVCGNPAQQKQYAIVLKKNSEWLTTYSNFGREEDKAIANDIAREVASYKSEFGKQYCIESMKNIEDAATKALETINKRPR